MVPESASLSWIAGLVAAYFLGSIPASWLIARYGFGVDLRHVGSGNVGATNAMRVVGPRAGVPAAFLDAAKGTLAVLLATRISADGGPLGLLGYKMGCGVIAVLGHTFTIFLRFRGGKGVATGAGVFLALAPGPLGLAFVTFATIVALTRYVSLASMVAAVSLPMWILALVEEGRDPLAAIATILGCLIVLRHRTNIQRLRRGDEPRFGIQVTAASRAAGEQS